MVRAIRALAVGGSILAMVVATGVQAQTGDAQGGGKPQAVGHDASTAADIVVTGSRVATTGANAPTPVTVVSTETLAKSTPSNIPDALNKLPIFQGSQQPRSSFSSAQQNAGGNVLNLRNFGSQRTLVLLDGHRVTPANTDNTISPDMLPQMLVSQVDIVTGGASAVYGSDAVTGVVNFRLNTKFTGLKLNVNTGLSTYGDGKSYRAGIAYGTKLFGDRGHFMASFEHYQRDPVKTLDRPYGPGVYVLTGNGSATSPFTATTNTRRSDYSFGGCIAPCSATGQQFVSNGVLGAFTPGTATGTGGQVSGGDGAYSVNSDALIGFKTDQAFGRFDYDVSDKVKFYASASYARQTATGTWFPVKLIPQNGATTTNTQGSTYFKNNAFLSAATQAALGNNGLANSSNVFSLGEYIQNLGAENYTGAKLSNENLNFNTGLTGDLGRFKWDLYYTHGRTINNVTNTHNVNQQKQLAASDAVLVNGTVQCYAATQAATAAQYANCVPLNPFGPTAMTQGMVNYFTENTTQRIINKLDDLGGSIAGDLLAGWAGPIRGALSGEYRRATYGTSSNIPAGAKVDCTGLRICNPNLGLYYSDSLGPVSVSNHVWEVAGELNVPLLADKPFFKSLLLNLAGRHTDYSTSGAVNTWKVGGIWQLNEDLRLRITRSLDIRAPTLDDLFRARTISVGTFSDVHTGQNYTPSIITQGNSSLKPERAQTLTFGGVFQPHFLRGFMLSADYYQIKLNNAIVQIQGVDNTIQQLCEAANGTGQYCSLYTRPNAFSDRSAANNATSVSTLLLNAALAEVKGVDIEAGYNHGPLSLRGFLNYQPVNRTQNFPGSITTRIAASKWRGTLIANYAITSDFHVGIQDNWLSSYSQRTLDNPSSGIYAADHVAAFNTIDFNMDHDIKTGVGTATAYLAIQNLANAKAPLVPQPGGVGIYYPVAQNYDIMGRYITIGFRMKI